jgi:hypothetical protein
MAILTLFIAYPLAALAVFGAFAALAAWRPRLLPVVTALVWAAYAWYEYLIHTRVLCSGECNIRVDLLLIYPILLVLSIWTLVSTFRRKRD